MSTTLAERFAAANLAEKRLEEVKARARDVATRENALRIAAAEAREAVLKIAGAAAAGEADAKALGAARKALREADSAVESVELELEGIGEYVQDAEAELKARRRELGLAVVDRCIEEVASVEATARFQFRWFAEAMRKRHQLAKLASVHATEASGHPSEPIGWSSLNVGMLARDTFDEGLASVLREHGLTESFCPSGGLEPLELSELLNLELRRERAEQLKQEQAKQPEQAPPTEAAQ